MDSPKVRCLPAVGFVAYAEDTGEALRGWRDLHGVPQTALADWMDVTQSVLSDYEGGRRENPGIGFVAEYVAGVVEVADGTGDESTGSNHDTPPQSLRGSGEEWGSVPGGVPEDIREAVHAVWDGFEQA